MEKEIITEVKIDGRVFTRRRARVRELSQAAVQPKGKEYEANAAQIACKIAIDGKPAVKEDILDLYEDELEEVMKLFPEVEEALKNELSR